MATCGQNPPIGQQQRNRVIASKSGQARHRCPRAGCRVPHLDGVSDIARGIARSLSPSASASHQHFAVRKQCKGVKFASSGHHRASVLPSRSGIVQIDDFCRCRGIGCATAGVKCARASAYEQYLAVIVHHCRSPITSPVVAIPHRAPSTSASNIKVPGRLSGPGTEHPPVRRNKHVWIDWQRQVRCTQVAPGRRCSLPYLRLDIGNPRLDRATDHQHVSVGQRGVRRVPSTVVHIRQPRPGIVQRVIDVGVGQPHPRA